jgi:hypothetical protein
MEELHMRLCPRRGFFLTSPGSSPLAGCNPHFDEIGGDE